MPTLRSLVDDHVAAPRRQRPPPFAHAWKAHHPDGGYGCRNLSTDPVPFVDETWTELCDAVLALGSRHIVEPVLTELQAADIVPIGTPMYNYSLAAALKAWLDQVTFHECRWHHDALWPPPVAGHTRTERRKAAFDNQERHLDSRHDPALAHLREHHERSYELALETAHRLGKEY